MNLGLFGGGIGLAIAGLIMGSVRGMTKNSDMWAIGFSAFAWLIALMIPNVPWAITIFLMGAIGITFAFMPTLRKIGDTNIFVLASISILVNLLLMFGSSAYDVSLNWNNDFELIQSDISSFLGAEVGNVDSSLPSNGLCRPGQTNCDSSILNNTFLDTLLYDVFASILAIGLYLAKAMIFFGMVVTAPYAMAYTIQNRVTNSIILYLIMTIPLIWNMAILYKVFAFMFNKRGMN